MSAMKLVDVALFQRELSARGMALSFDEAIALLELATPAPVYSDRPDNMGMRLSAAQFVQEMMTKHRVGIVIIGGADLETGNSFTLTQLDDRDELTALTELTEIAAERIYGTALKVKLVRVMHASRGETR
jgi:hypothetical protein